MDKKIIVECYWCQTEFEPSDLHLRRYDRLEEFPVCDSCLFGKVLESSRVSKDGEAIPVNEP